MTNPIATAAIALAEMAPLISRWFSDSDESTETTRMIASRVVGVAKEVTGQKDAWSAVRKLETDPKLILEFQRTIASLDQDLEKTFLEDRMSARMRDATIVSQGRHNWRADVMVFSAASGLVACLVSLAFFKGSLPGEAVGIISTIAGIFGSCLKDAYAFEFGSSRGSKNKDAALMFGK